MRKRTLKEELCENCGKIYFRNRVNRKYCSKECAKSGQAYYRNRIDIEKTCVLCGNIYRTFKKRQIYCSEECYKKTRKAYSISYKIGRPTGFLRMRFQVLQRDNFRCRYCGRGTMEGVILEIDHIIPKKLNGTDELSNYITACSQCNKGKSDILLLANKNGQLPTFISF